MENFTESTLGREEIQKRLAVLPDFELLVRIAAGNPPEQTQPQPPVLSCPHCHGSLQLVPVAVDRETECSEHIDVRLCEAEMRARLSRKES